MTRQEAAPQVAINSGLTPRRVKETPEYIGFVRRAIAAAARRVAEDADPAGLVDLAALSGEIDAAIRSAVHALRLRGYSWADIGAALGVTPQGAHKRWRDPLAARNFRSALSELHLGAGQPGSRVIAARAGVSHTTVADALSGRRVPAWATTEKIVAALAGSTEEFWKLWQDARR